MIPQTKQRRVRDPPIVNDAAPLLTVGDLKRIMSKRQREAIGSVEDLERLFRLE